MLKLTKKADYGMMAMHYLAQHADEGPHSARDIAESYSIPFPILAKTLQQLARAQLIASQHGSAGGYVLSRPAHTISTLDIISAFDGPPVITSCATLHGRCDMANHCKVKEPLLRVNESIRGLLCRITVADLIDTPNRSQQAIDKTLISILH